MSHADLAGELVDPAVWDRFIFNLDFWGVTEDMLQRMCFAYHPDPCHRGWHIDMIGKFRDGRGR